MDKENEFRVQFLFFGGPDGSPGELDAVLLLHATRGAGTRGVGFPNRDPSKWEASASLLVAQTDNGEVRFTRFAKSVRSIDMEHIRESLRALRGAGENIRVQGNLDTSPGWTHLSLAVFDVGEEWKFELPLRLSGFGGEQAEALSEAIQVMIRSVGAEGVWILKRLTT